MKSTGEKFTEIANPHSWLLAADNLHAQAKNLYREQGQRMLTFVSSDGSEISSDLSDKSVYLLAGFALENAIKSFLVYENPHWRSNGKLSKQLRSHSLVSLHRKSELIPYRNKYIWVLDAFEQGLESWARYPCGLSYETSLKEGHISPKLWEGYLRLMKAYGNKMTHLLRGGWVGPHEFSGRWKFRENFLDMT
jgi:hypothetical protein